LNPPIITKVAWRPMPAVSICCFCVCFDRINARFAKFQLHDALTLSDAACGLGVGLALLLGGGAILFLPPPAPSAKEAAA
jgi:multisubunit Na+/H+ antiporter MnhB subunit